MRDTVKTRVAIGDLNCAFQNWIRDYLGLGSWGRDWPLPRLVVQGLFCPKCDCNVVCGLLLMRVSSSPWCNLLPPDGSAFICSVQSWLSASPNVHPR